VELIFGPGLPPASFFRAGLLVYRNTDEKYYIRPMRPWGPGSYGVFMGFGFDNFSKRDFAHPMFGMVLSRLPSKYGIWSIPGSAIRAI
jgi:hypothetical protein